MRILGNPCLHGRNLMEETNEHDQLHGHAMCVLAEGPMLQRAQGLVSCSAVTILKS